VKPPILIRCKDSLHKHHAEKPQQGQPLSAPQPLPYHQNIVAFLGDSVIPALLNGFEKHRNHSGFFPN
jgi:hypothetical protein